MTSSKTKRIKDTGDVVLSEMTFEWSIKNFSDICENVGDIILSPVFTHGSHLEFSWRLELYPYGRNEESSNFLSLFFRKVNFCNVKTSFALSIKNMPRTNITGNDKIFSFNITRWGIEKYINRKEVIESIKCSDDVLTITCTIFDVDIINKSNSSRIGNVKLDALGDIGQLYNNKNLSDVILRVNSKEFKVHKAILSARSKVFAAMFKHDMIENNKNMVEIENINSEIMDAMLKFMYTGEVENIQTTAKELLEAADRYAIEDLKEICISYLGRIINVDNAIDLLLYAEHYNLNELKTKTMNFIADNVKKIVGKPEFDLIKNAPWNIIKDLFSKLATDLKT